MGKMCRQNMLEGWLSSVTQEAVAGMFPGAADTTNFAKSKEPDIKWLEEDLSVSTYFARTIAILPDFVEASYQTFLAALKRENSLTGLQVDIEDKVVAELVRCLETCCS
jgi:hypothetical protein